MRTLHFYGKNSTEPGTWDQVIGERLDFNANNMSGRRVNGARLSDCGELPYEYARELVSTDVDYIVFSWSTPIMWHDATTDKWRFPRVSYSQSTSRHQRVAEFAIKIWDGTKWNTPECFDDSGAPAEVPCGGR